MTTEPAIATTVTTMVTYLQLPTRAAFQPAFLPGPDLLVLQAREPLVAYYRFLYDAVGRDYDWTDRVDWSDARLQAHLARPALTLLVLYVRGTPAGFIELDTDDDPAEPGTAVVYFGLIPAFHGRGLGKHLLSAGVERAFADGATRVWLHTCDLDGPHALANYRARGFQPYRTATARQLVYRHDPPTPSPAPP